jgi:hypothetical protein
MEENFRRIKNEDVEVIVQNRLERAIEKAEERRDTEQATNPELRFALDIVEQFLRRKRRVCYGGTAMNAQLPPDLQFYNPEYDLPDYDFFTPDIQSDTDELVNNLKRAGFEEVASRIGMHEGTKKILVNYVAVADISEMGPDIFEIIQKRAVNINGIYYTDPDVLRMMMYLELSRPKGEVSRWTKVYERLTLINTVFPMKRCEKRDRKPKQIPIGIRDLVHRYVIDNQRILAGARLEKVYYKSLKSRKAQKWETRQGGAVVFFSPDIKKDALELRQKLGPRGVEIQYFKATEDMIPPRLLLKLFNTPVVLLIEHTACHSYNTMIEAKTGKTVFIASLESLITLYLFLGIFTHDEENIFGFSLMCAVERFIDVNNQLQRAKPVRQFSPFPLECQGYQKGYPTLLREKVKRIADEKVSAKLRLLTKKNRKTKRVNKKNLNKTIKNKEKTG